MKSALVIEGGGMRGIFAAGVLDGFLEEKFDPFDLYIGVSAGACNIGSFLAGQYQRTYRIFTNLMTSSQCISLKKFIMGGHLMDLDWLWDTIDREETLDAAAAVRYAAEKKKEFLIVATSVETGEPIYFKPTAEDMSLLMKGSSSMPVIYRGFVETARGPVTDGGVGDAIPVIKAYEEGARKIVVIRSRPSSYNKKEGLETRVTTFFMRKYPELCAALENKAASYRQALDFIHNPPEDLSLIEIAPPEDMRSGRTTRDMDALNADYETGVKMGKGVEDSWEFEV
ncbi:MAG: patatin family protein [bacterium]|nr:patatin family protein [bacterium]